MHIDFSRGRFKLIFTSRESIPSATPLDERASKWGRIAIALGIALAIAIGLCIYWGISAARWRRAAINSGAVLWQPALEEFWSPFLNSSIPTVICVGAPIRRRNLRSSEWNRRDPCTDKPSARSARERGDPGCGGDCHCGHAGRYAVRDFRGLHARLASAYPPAQRQNPSLLPGCYLRQGQEVDSRRDFLRCAPRPGHPLSPSRHTLLLKEPGDWPWSGWRFYFLKDASLPAMDRVPREGDGGLTIARGAYIPTKNVATYAPPARPLSSCFFPFSDLHFLISRRELRMGLGGVRALRKRIV